MSCGVASVMGSKRCTGCGEVKSLESFHRMRAAKDGRQGRCRACCVKGAPREPREVLPDGFKRCFGCKEVKSLDNFHRRSSAPGGRNSRCRTCRRKSPHREVLPEGLKRCPRCKEIQGLDCFNVSSRSSDGLAYTCKPCLRRAAKASKPYTYRVTHKESGEFYVGSSSMIWADRIRDHIRKKATRLSRMLDRHHATIDDCRVEFTRYGTVIDARCAEADLLAKHRGDPKCVNKIVGIGGGYVYHYRFAGGAKYVGSTCNPARRRVKHGERASTLRKALRLRGVPWDGAEYTHVHFDEYYDAIKMELRCLAVARDADEYLNRKGY